MKLRAVLAGLAALAVPQAGSAHHSFAMFDNSKEVELKNATVQEWQWTSPHTWLYVQVPGANGVIDKYSLEGGNPGALRRVGFTKGSMSVGDKLTIYMSPLRSGMKGGAITAVRLPDGRLLGKRLKVR